MKTKLKLSKTTFLLSVILLLGLAFRLLSIQENNIIIGFDQARDLFASKTIWTNHDIKLIGPTAGNNTDLHHGILWLYFILPAIIVFGGNPYWVAVWTSLVNLLSVIVIYFFAKSLFGENDKKQKNKDIKTNGERIGLIAALLAAVSFYFIQYAGWLSNPAPTLTTVPLFFFGVWEYYKQKKWGLVLALFALGLSIQFELFFIYLIPIFLLLWFVLRLRFPDIKTLILAVSSFCLITSTMIVTEIKYNFSGVLSILGAGKQVGRNESIFANIPKYIERFLATFSQTLLPSHVFFGKIIGIITVALFGYLIFKNFKDKKELNKYLFVFIYLMSSSIMLLLGYHGAPWFLIGLPPTIVIAIGFLLSKIKNNFILFTVLFLILISNYLSLSQSTGKGQMLLEPDRAAIMNQQLKVINYTYAASNGEPFVINTLTNPLYINAVWGYHYDWYSWQKNEYGGIPSWGGGDQLYPYDVLPKTTGGEKYLYLIIDTTPRIPYVHTLLMQQWADERSTLLEEKEFDGIKVEKRLINKF